jgi:tetratricopeptide (TPR) repeat protein
VWWSEWFWQIAVYHHLILWCLKELPLKTIKQVLSKGCYVFFVITLCCAISYGESQQDENNRGEVLLREGLKLLNTNTNSALEKFEAALTIFARAGNKPSIGAVYKAIGSAYISLGNNNKAISYYENSLAIAKETSDKELMWRNLLNIGKPGSMGRRRIGNSEAD